MLWAVTSVFVVHRGQYYFWLTQTDLNPPLSSLINRSHGSASHLVRPHDTLILQGSENTEGRVEYLEFDTQRYLFWYFTLSDPHILSESETRNDGIGASGLTSHSPPTAFQIHRTSTWIISHWLHLTSTFMGNTLCRNRRRIRLAVRFTVHLFSKPHPPHKLWVITKRRRIRYKWPGFFHWVLIV